MAETKVKLFALREKELALVVSQANGSAFVFVLLSGIMADAMFTGYYMYNIRRLHDTTPIWLELCAAASIYAAIFTPLAGVWCSMMLTVLPVRKALMGHPDDFSESVDELQREFRRVIPPLHGLCMGAIFTTVATWSWATLLDGTRTAGLTATILVSVLSGGMLITVCFVMKATRQTFGADLMEAELVSAKWHHEIARPSRLKRSVSDLQSSWRGASWRGGASGGPKAPSPTSATVSSGSQALRRSHSFTLPSWLERRSRADGAGDSEWRYRPLADNDTAPSTSAVAAAHGGVTTGNAASRNPSRPSTPPTAQAAVPAEATTSAGSNPAPPFPLVRAASARAWEVVRPTLKRSLSFGSLGGSLSGSLSGTRAQSTSPDTDGTAAGAAAAAAGVLNWTVVEATIGLQAEGRVTAAGGGGDAATTPLSAEPSRLPIPPPALLSTPPTLLDGLSTGGLLGRGPSPAAARASRRSTSRASCRRLSENSVYLSETTKVYVDPNADANADPNTDPSTSDGHPSELIACASAPLSIAAVAATAAAAAASPPPPPLSDAAHATDASAAAMAAPAVRAAEPMRVAALVPTSVAAAAAANSDEIPLPPPPPPLLPPPPPPLSHRSTPPAPRWPSRGALSTSSARNATSAHNATSASSRSSVHSTASTAGRGPTEETRRSTALAALAAEARSHACAVGSGSPIGLRPEEVAQLEQMRRRAAAEGEEA